MARLREKCLALVCVLSVNAIILAPYMKMKLEATIGDGKLSVLAIVNGLQLEWF